MKNKSKTLVMLTPAFPASEMETSWVTTQQLFARTFREQFPSLQIVILSFYYPERVGNYDWRGLQVSSFNGAKGGNHKLKRIFFWRGVWKKLRTLHKDNDLIGLFSFWCGECALIGHYFGKRYGLPHYCWLCGQDAREKNKLVKLIRPRPQELIAMSDFLVREFQRNHGIRPQHMIPNAIDPGLYPVLASRERDIHVLGVGSLSWLKQYDVFVGIIEALRGPFPEIRAIICGEGEAREELEALIERKGLREHVALPGLMPHEEVLGLMQRAKVLLHTSNYEGFGVVCLEALYAGAHVISFCRPMEQDIPHWHIVGSMEEMIEKAGNILRNPNTNYTPVLPYTMSNTVKSVMKLFAK
ncbi:MAG: glycosyltransferase [Chitinophagaceae bacterium]|nr:glycosyltransferase [Chitinophagaceae bacterium]